MYVAWLPDAIQIASLSALWSSGSSMGIMIDNCAAAVQECLNVINYDAPVHSTTYVHRAGRTARAGRAGQVFSLMRPEEMRHFKSMLRKIDNAFVKDYAIKEERLKTLKPAFDVAFRSVRDEAISHK